MALIAVMVQLTRTEQLLRPEPSRVPKQTHMGHLPPGHLLEQCQLRAQTRMDQLRLGQRPQLPTPTLLHRLRLLQHQQLRRQLNTRQIGYGHSRLAGCFSTLPASFVFELQ